MKYSRNEVDSFITKIKDQYCNKAEQKIVDLRISLFDFARDEDAISGDTQKSLDSYISEYHGGILYEWTLLLQILEEALTEHQSDFAASIRLKCRIYFRLFRFTK